MRYDFITQPSEKQICFLVAGMNVHISKPADMKILEKTTRNHKRRIFIKWEILKIKFIL